jgi:peptidoglycan L-alanyl-D-glutamate endopeptidase CwlK
MQAIHQAVCGHPDASAAAILVRPLDERSERCIASLHPQVQPLARSLIQIAAEHGVEIRVISGNRSYEEQNVLFSQGRTTAGKIVTRAQGGWSNHNFGLAFDVGVWENGQYQPESKSYRIVGNLGKAIGLDWGGDWKSIVDEPHFEVVPKWAQSLFEPARLAEYRARKERGTDLFA